MKQPFKDINDPRFVKAMSHPLRVRILALLRERDASPAELSEMLDASLGTVAYHVRVMERLGLVELVKETRVRGAIEHHYRAVAYPIITDEAWGKASPIAKQATVNAHLATTDEYVQASAAAGGFDRADAHLSRRVLRLDDMGFAQLARACEKLLRETKNIEEAAAKRIERNPHAEDVVDAGLAIMLFEAVRLTDIRRREADAKRSDSKRRRRQRSRATDAS